MEVLAFLVKNYQGSGLVSLRVNKFTMFPQNEKIGLDLNHNLRLISCRKGKIGRALFVEVIRLRFTIFKLNICCN